MSCLLLTADRILNVRTGQILSNTGILILDDRISNLVNLNENIPDCPFLDLGNVTILPGFIDCHTHLTYHYDKNGMFGKTNPTPQEALMYTADNVQKTLQAGYTTVRDLGSPSAVINPIIELIRTGQIIGPDIITSENPIFPPEINSHNIEDIVVDRIQNGAGVIKVFLDADSNGNVPVSLEDMTRLVNTAHRRGMKVAVHSHDAPGVKNAVLAGADSIEHGTFLNDECIQMMRDHNIYFVPTLYLPNHYLENKHRFAFDQNTWDFFRKMSTNGISSARKAIQNGVLIAYGTDAVAGISGNNSREFPYLLKAGLSPLQVIQSATINAADLIGIHDIGEIKPGYKADLIAVRGDLRDPNTFMPNNVIFVMKDGYIVKKN